MVDVKKLRTFTILRPADQPSAWIGVVDVQKLWIIANFFWPGNGRESLLRGLRGLSLEPAALGSSPPVRRLSRLGRKNLARLRKPSCANAGFWMQVVPASCSRFHDSKLQEADTPEEMQVARPSAPGVREMDKRAAGKLFPLAVWRQPQVHRHRHVVVSRANFLRKHGFPFPHESFGPSINSVLFRHTNKNPIQTKQ